MALDYIMQCQDCKRVSFDRTQWYSTTEIREYEYYTKMDRVLPVYCQNCGEFRLRDYGLVGIRI